MLNVIFTILINMIDVKIKKLVPEAVIPSPATEGSAGMDVTAVGREYDNRNDCWIYHTGLAFQLPKDHVMLIFPRSSNRKTNYYLANHVGVLDSDYTGELMLMFKSRDASEFRFVKAPYEVGDRIGQIIILPYPKVKFNEVDNLDNTERGDGGFGSTGK